MRRANPYGVSALDTSCSGKVEGISLSGESIAQRRAGVHGWGEGRGDEGNVGMDANSHGVATDADGKHRARLYCWVAHCADVLFY